MKDVVKAIWQCLYPLFHSLLLLFLQKMCTVRQVPLYVRSLNSAHVFILDMEQTLYVWCGKTCSEDEVGKAIEYAQKLKVCEHASKKRSASNTSFLVLLIPFVFPLD